MKIHNRAIYYFWIMLLAGTFSLFTVEAKTVKKPGPPQIHIEVKFDSAQNHYLAEIGVNFPKDNGGAPITEVRISQKTTGTFTVVAKGSGQSYQIPVKPLTMYYFKGRVRNSAGFSPYSNVVEITVPRKP